MINIVRGNPPRENFSHKDNDIKSAIKEIFYGKCYICEEYTRQSEIDHFFPSSKFEKLVNDWENLFYSCTKCNKMKSHIINSTEENQILNCTIDDVEKLLELEMITDSQFIEIKTNNPENLKATKTVEFLNKIYNGDGKVKNLNFIELRKNILDELKEFELIIEKFKSNSFLVEQYKKDLIKRIQKKNNSRESTFVSFKRKVVKDRMELHFLLSFFD